MKLLIVSFFFSFFVQESFANGLLCSQIFTSEKSALADASLAFSSVITTVEIEIPTQSSGSSFFQNLFINTALSEQIQNLAQEASVKAALPLSDINVTLSVLTNEHLVILVRGASKEWTQAFMNDLKQQPELLNLIAQSIGDPSQSHRVLSFDGHDGSVSFKDSTENIQRPFLFATSLGFHQINPQALVFEGKHAFPLFEKNLAMIRRSWDARFPLSYFKEIGLENDFGTLIEQGSRLVGLTISGISVKIKRILAKPLETATIQEFFGRVLSVENINNGGMDPVWLAKIQTADGILEVNLSESRGLRVAKSLTRDSFSGGEIEATKARREKSYADFVARESQSVPSNLRESQHERLQKRWDQLPAEIKLEFENLRERLVKVLSGQSILENSQGLRPLQRETYDKTMRPLAVLKDESYRPLVEEVQRLLYDTDSNYGFTRWMVDFALEVYLDLYDRGALQFQTKQISLRDPRENFPFAEGMHGMSRASMTLESMPITDESDLIAAIDRRIHLYGFDKDLSKVPNVQLVPGAKYLATLRGLSLEDTTIFFVKYSQHNLLFQDTYFIGKPHGQYSHIFQWLYLAERFSHPEQNSFHASLLPSLMTVQPYFMEDFPTGVRVTDFVGQRSPQNPDYVNAQLEVLF
ncbi:MAG TPA: hypothetical protein VN132_01010 [Bdellovibrio sp.]|nr:hypothetical protein [Bdellovibrio sp.]